jgi:hypothetical protein
MRPARTSSTSISPSIAGAIASIAPARASTSAAHNSGCTGTVPGIAGGPSSGAGISSRSSASIRRRASASAASETPRRASVAYSSRAKRSHSPAAAIA